MTMTDNRTTELLDGLRNVGNLHEFAELFGFDWHDDSDWTWHDVAVKMADELEQAIAATLGSDAKPCYATDYTHEHCKYSVNRGWVENIAHGTLTADDVRDLIERHSAWVIGNNRCFHNGAYEEIADELNAHVGRTCKLEPLSALDVTLNMLDQTEWGACSECGCAVPMDARFCNECGKAVSE